MSPSSHFVPSYLFLFVVQSNDNINNISADWPSITFGIRVGDDGAAFFIFFLLNAE
jgi:hypothetical protein